MNIQKRRRKKKYCVWCGAKFVPNFRLKGRQKSCGSDDCKREQNLLAQKRWKKNNLAVCRQSREDWWKDHEKNYWKLWREKHPAYVVRNRILTRVRKASLQRKLDILQPFEKQVKFAHYCGLQRKLDRLFQYPSFISLPHARAQSHQESRAP